MFFSMTVSLRSRSKQRRHGSDKHQKANVRPKYGKRAQHVTVQKYRSGQINPYFQFIESNIALNWRHLPTRPRNYILQLAYFLLITISVANQICESYKGYLREFYVIIGRATTRKAHVIKRSARTKQMGRSITLI